VLAAARRPGMPPDQETPASAGTWWRPRSGFFRVGLEMAFRLPEAGRHMVELSPRWGEHYRDDRQADTICSAGCLAVTFGTPSQRRGRPQVRCV
jgi:hypothetical protein